MRPKARALGIPGIRLRIRSRVRVKAGEKGGGARISFSHCFRLVKVYVCD